MSSDPSRTAKPRRHLIIAAKLAVSIVLLAVLFSRIDVGSLWRSAKQASLGWLVIALALYMTTILASVWRWWLLLKAQGVPVAPRRLLESFLVALYFNNFLPSNIGGDVIRVGDTAKPARSKTVATAVVLVDRAMGLMGLVLVAACGATAAAAASTHSPIPIWPSWLWAGFFLGVAAGAPAFWAPAGVGRLLQPLTVVHPEWVGGRIDAVTATLARFRAHPVALASCFAGAVFVQVGTVAFYAAVAYALKIHVAPADLAVAVPVAGVVQMLPISINGFGVREAAFSFYFTRIGLPLAGALLLSLSATGLVMLFSLGGAAVYVARGHH